ncbi:alpha/beta fold hydrolase [Pseudonocardia sp. NPDC046786]|uniref:alpha/beta fold hydrolase n=1 Tax=Pseudonocardia sp. NPDC046786 TaxID=3155471 RepID=UPI003406CB45
MARARRADLRPDRGQRGELHQPLRARRRRAWRHRLARITAPTLVLHGTDDPFLPPGHGEALAAEIPGARLVPVPGAGHEPPPRSRWDVVLPAIVEHTRP